MEKRSRFGSMRKATASSRRRKRVRSKRSCVSTSSIGTKGSIPRRSSSDTSRSMITIRYATRFCSTFQTTHVVALLAEKRCAVENFSTRSEQSMTTRDRDVGARAAEVPTTQRDSIGRSERYVLEIEIVIGRRRREPEIHGARSRPRDETRKRVGQTDGRSEHESDHQTQQNLLPVFSNRHRA